MNGKFKLRKDKKPNMKGEYCVYLQYCTMGKPSKKSMKMWIHPDYWLGDNGDDKYIKRGKGGHPKADILNQKLVNIKKKYDIMIDDLLNEPNSVLTVPGLKSVLNGTFKEKQEQAKGKVPLVEYVLKVNEDRFNMGKIGYSVWCNIQCNMNRFNEFVKNWKNMNTNSNNVLYSKDLNVDLVREYINWRQSKGNTNETINKSLTPIFKSVEKMMRLGWIDRGVGEEILELYLPTNSKSLCDYNKDNHHLTVEQIKSLMKIAEQSKYQRTRELVDLFMFSIYTCGLRFSDVCTLRWSEVDMESGIITHLQVKNHTRKPIILTIPIKDEGMKILKKWEGKNDNFVFDMLPSDFDLNDEEKLKMRINSLNKTMNQSLRRIGEKIDLPYNLHFHCARHTFGTLALNSGVEMDMVSQLMGHSSTTVTEKVYSKYLPETISRVANEKLNFKFAC